jgi:hypothetical protein
VLYSVAEIAVFYVAVFAVFYFTANKGLYRFCLHSKPPAFPTVK